MNRRENSERHPSKEPTSAQLATAKIAAYLASETIIKHAAREITGKKFGKEYKQAKQGLTDLYFIREHKLPEESFDIKWGEKAQIFRETLNLIDSELKEANDAALEHPEERNAWNRAIVIDKTFKDAPKEKI